MNGPSTTTFDWRQRIWTAPGAPATDAEVIIAADWAPIRAFAPIIADDPLAIYGNLLPVLRRADLRIANLECPLTDDLQPVHKSGSVLRGEPKHIQGLAEVPFDILTLGNNHLFDHGIDGFAQTLDLLRDNGLRWLGAGLTAEAARQPLITEVNGIRLALVNFSEGEDLTAVGEGPGVFGWEVERVTDMVASLKEQADVILVICHCGVEYIAFPPPYVTRAFEAIAAAGAHLVIGHHPHVPQGITLHRGVPICYSQGNFVFYQETGLFFRKCGYLVAAGLFRGGLARLEVIPYGIDDRGVSLLEGPFLERFSEALQAVSLPLADPRQVASAWHGFLCRYGKQGFENEIRMLMEQLQQDPPKGAAMFRNRIATMQHNQHWIDALTRIMDGSIKTAPAWALALHEQWMTEPC